MKKVFAPLALLAAALAAVLPAVVACEPAPRTIERGTSPVSGALAVTRDNDRILIADEDRDQLIILDRTTKQITGTVALGDGPAHVIELADGSAAVTMRYGNTVAIVDVTQAAVTKTIAVGAEPFGLVEVSDGLLAVALHHHMTSTQPAIYFVHYWGTGSTEKLATAFKAALDQLGKR